MRPIQPYREAIGSLINSLARFRRCSHDIGYFLEVWGGSGSMLTTRSIEIFIAHHVDGLLATGHLRHRYMFRREPDPWEGREEDEQKVIAWLLRPDSDRMLREKRAAYQVKRPSDAAERLEELRARWRGDGDTNPGE